MTISPKIHKWQYTHEKILNIINHWENTNQNHKTPLNITMAIIKKTEDNKCRCGAQKLKLLSTAGENVK